MDLIWRCLVFVMAMMCGSRWVVSIIFRSVMVVCIPRVLRVSVLRLWYVKMGFAGDDRDGGGLWELSWVGWLGA